MQDLISLGCFDGQTQFQTDMRIESCGKIVNIYQPSAEEDGEMHCVSLTRGQILLILKELLS